MADIRIVRSHALGLGGARALARRWADEAERGYGLACRWEAGDAADRVAFVRSGLQGELRVAADRLELDLRLGFLLRPYRARIEAALNQNLDRELAG